MNSERNWNRLNWDKYKASSILFLESVIIDRLILPLPGLWAKEGLWGRVAERQHCLFPGNAYILSLLREGFQKASYPEAAKRIGGKETMRGQARFLPHCNPCRPSLAKSHYVGVYRMWVGEEIYTGCKQLFHINGMSLSSYYWALSYTNTASACKFGGGK